MQLRDKDASDDEIVAAGPQRFATSATRRARCSSSTTGPTSRSRATPTACTSARTTCAIAKARAMVGGERIVGTSTHSPAQVDAAEAADVDYYACGPVFETPTKPGRPAVGWELISLRRRAGDEAVVRDRRDRPEDGAERRRRGGVARRRGAGDPRRRGSRARRARVEGEPWVSARASRVRGPPPTTARRGEEPGRARGARAARGGRAPGRRDGRRATSRWRSRSAEIPLYFVYNGDDRPVGRRPDLLPRPDADDGLGAVEGEVLGRARVPGAARARDPRLRGRAADREQRRGRADLPGRHRRRGTLFWYMVKAMARIQMPER